MAESKSDGTIPVNWERLVASILVISITGLYGWVWSTQNRVTILELQLVSIEEKAKTAVSNDKQLAVLAEQVRAFDSTLQEIKIDVKRILKDRGNP